MMRRERGKKASFLRRVSCPCFACFHSLKDFGLRVYLCRSKKLSLSLCTATPRRECERKNDPVQAERSRRVEWRARPTARCLSKHAFQFFFSFSLSAQPKLRERFAFPASANAPEQVDGGSCHLRGRQEARRKRTAAADARDSEKEAMMRPDRRVD